MDATTADNVHHLPTPVEKIGYALRDGHERMQRGEQEWIEGALMVADALYAGARSSSPITTLVAGSSSLAIISTRRTIALH